MLYDPSKEYKAPVKDIWTLESFSAWLDTQDPAKKYMFAIPQNCAVTQYLNAYGITGSDAWLDPDQLRELGWLDIVYYCNVEISDGHTFGVTAKRARRALRWQKAMKVFNPVRWFR